MDLAELSRRSSIDRRKLRYVLDHKLVPELSIEIKDDQIGRPRHFAEDVGFGIVCAARLQQAGLPHGTIRKFLSALLGIKFNKQDPSPALAYVLQQDYFAYADWGDNEFTRLRVDEWDSGWYQFNLRKLKKGVDPLLVITLNIGRIRDSVFR